jgi:putative transposase
MGHEESFRLRSAIGREAPISFKGYRFPPDIISYVVWLYYRFPLSLRMVEEMLAARGIELTYETVRCWATKFGLAIARRIRSTAPGRGDKWHLDGGRNVSRRLCTSTSSTAPC